jgi:CHAT domain-containing protein
VKKLVFIAIVLCSCAIACNREDTPPAEGWRRTTESRFTGVTWASCKNGCVKTKPKTAVTCDGLIGTRAAAVDLLLNHDACLDSAIAALERFQANDPLAKSDLAAAYYVRAARDDRPIDSLRSLNAADGDSPAAMFNRALAQEALGFYEESIATWEQVAKTKEKDWAGEAQEHVARLRAVVGNDAAVRWKNATDNLPKILQPKDRAAVAALVAEFPFSAQRYFEGIVVRAWADDPTPQNLENARIFATELSLGLKDPFDLQVIAAIDHASAEQRIALREGHRLLAEAYIHLKELRAQPAIEALAQSARQFERGGSPFRLLAELGRANALLFEHPDEALAVIDRLQPVAEENGYRHLLVRLHGNRSNALFFNGRPLESLSTLARTLAEYEPFGDRESIFRTSIADIGIYRTIGRADVSWERALPAVRNALQMADSARRHALYGDAAATAAALNFPAIALAYQNVPIRYFQRQLIHTTDEAAIHTLQQNIGIALRARAGIEVQLHRLPEASEDLNEAVRLFSWKPDDPITNSLLMSLDATRGESLLQYNPTAAAEAFSSALLRSEAGKYHTFRARILGLQAIALRRARHFQEAKVSLKKAIEEIHVEESRSLASRTRESSDESWSAYFARFQDTYRLLIGQLVDEPDAQGAFRYAETARGHEPLNLLSERSTAPKSLKAISRNGEAIKLEDIQKELPAGTFLFEYCVLDDRTFVWVISRDSFDVIQLPVTRKEIALWSERIQGAANRNPTTFDAVLFAQYERLIDAPLTMAKSMNQGCPLARLVIIPDGPMHGLPLGSSRKNAPGLPYLFQEMPIEIDGSASLYLASLLRDRDLQSSTAQRALLIGNPVVDPKWGKFDDLTGADAEVAQLAALYKADVVSRSGSAATIPEFLRLAKDAAIVHIAAHGIVDAAALSRSAILLTPSAGGDGALDAETLLRELHLDRTRLVVLSTCTSAGGLPVGPEGVAPLVRPIIAAGAPAVIGSLWKVADDTSATLFVSFHKHYRNGLDAATALQKAQIEMLNENPGAPWPAMTWTSFQVIGHASSPFAPRTTQQKEKPP